MLPTSTAADLKVHLEALGVTPGDHLAVHSRLLSFGLIDGGAETVFAALTAAVCRYATLAGLPSPGTAAAKVTAMAEAAARSRLYDGTSTVTVEQVSDAI